MEIVKLKNRGLPCCAWRTSAGELWVEDSCMLEGIRGWVGTGAGFEELLASWICLWCESQGYVYFK